MPVLRGTKEAKAAAAGAEKLPAGTYIVRCDKTWTKNGRYTMRFVAVEGEHKGKTVTDGFGLESSMSKGILMRRVAAMGVAMQEDANEAYFEDDAPVGCFAEVDVIQKDEYANVKQLRRVSDETRFAILERLEKEAEMEPTGASVASDEDESGVPF